MKKLIILLLVFAGFMACENESIQELPQETSVTEDMNARMGDKIDVCHYDAENDSWHVINISANAWEAHEKHGDVMLVDADGDGWVTLENECGVPVDCDDTNDQLTDNCTADCFFIPAVEELNLTCWNGDPNDPILWDANPAYGLCSNCVGGRPAYGTPKLGNQYSESPDSEDCRLYLVQLANDLNLGIGPFCTSQERVSSDVKVFSQ